MTEARDWGRLARLIRDRRKELRLSHAKIRALGGPSQATMLKLERGEPTSVKDETKDRLEGALRWALGSVDAILSGGEPTPALPPGTGGRAEVLYEGPGERIIIDIVDGVGELSDDQRRQILALIRAMQETKERGKS